jgi:hypothetical protein
MFNDEKLPVSLVLDPPGGTLQDPKWASSDESIFTVDVAPDGMSVLAVSVDGAQGVATLSFTDAGAVPLSASMDIPVMNRPVEATGVQMVAGEAVPK